jgi:hypothetical protein
MHTISTHTINLRAFTVRSVLFNPSEVQKEELKSSKRFVHPIALITTAKQETIIALIQFESYRIRDGNSIKQKYNPCLFH